MELDQWVAVAMSGVVAVASTITLVKMIVDAVRHKRETREWEKRRDEVRMWKEIKDEE